MGEFFRGWKRKAGLLMLILACALTTAWMRSRHIVDQLESGSILGLFLRVDSELGEVCCMSWTDNPARGWSWESFAVDQVWSDRNQDVTGKTPFRQQIFRLCGFALRNPASNQIYRANGFVCHYSCFVLPLTAISAWLLLSKPKHQAPKPTAG